MTSERSRRCPPIVLVLVLLAERCACLVDRAAPARVHSRAAARRCAMCAAPPPFSVGDRVDGLYMASRLGTSFGCKWCVGTIVDDAAGGFTVRYDDGDLEENVKPEFVRASTAPPAPAPSDDGPDGSSDAEWIVRLREQALRSSERRVSALQSFADAIRPAEQSLSKLGLELRLVDEKTGLPITPDSFVFLGVLAALQWSLLNLLLAPFRGA